MKKTKLNSYLHQEKGSRLYRKTVYKRCIFYASKSNAYVMLMLIGFYQNYNQGSVQLAIATMRPDLHIKFENLQVC